jgi:mannose-6-phosphate isomerase-like protein (cupin superfamily)
MYVKHLKNCLQIRAGDNSLLREIINPNKKEINTHYSLAWAKIAPHKKTLHHTLTFSEVYYILRGTGIMHINNEEKTVRENDTIYVPANAIQYIENIGKTDLKFLCIVDPAWQPAIEHVFRDDTNEE